jgi:hypothetical protein
MKAKQETTNKLLTDYEQKYISCEKEKVISLLIKNKLKKEYDLLLRENEEIKALSQTSGKK